MKKTKVFDIPLNPYPCTLHLIICNKNLAHDEIKKYINPEQKKFDNTLGYVNSKDSEIVMWLPKPPRTIEELSVLVHECMHVIISVDRYVDLEYKRQRSNEAFAYLIDYIFKNVLILSRQK